MSDQESKVEESPKDGVQPSNASEAQPVPADASERAEQPSSAPHLPESVLSELELDSRWREQRRHRSCAECLTPYPADVHAIGGTLEGRCPNCGSGSYKITVE